MTKYYRVGVREWQHSFLEQTILNQMATERQLIDYNARCLNVVLVGALLRPK
jgi:hypothetical protein